MAQKTFSKHSEYRTYSTKGAYDDGDFDNMKTELLPSKYGSLIQPGNGAPVGNKEYYYEYKEQKDPAGTYDRKDLHTVEQYEISHSPGRYADNVRPAITSTPHRHVTSSTTSTVRKGDLTQNIEELDSLLDDLQRDQERKPYKSGYSSDTMESSSFDYRSMNTPVKSSGYSTLSKLERDAEWLPPTQPLSGTVTREVNREVVRNFTESHVLPVTGQSVPAVGCDKCHGPPTVQAGVPMNKVTTTVKTYTYEVPADQDPAVVPIPGSASVTNTQDRYLTTQQDKYLSTQQDRSYAVREDQEHRTYVNTQFNTSTPIGSPIRQPSPLPPPTTHYRETTTTTKSAPPPHVCPHMDSHARTHTTHTITKNTSLPAPPPQTCVHCSQKLTTVTSVQSCPNCPAPGTGGTPHTCPNCSAPGVGWPPHVCPNCSNSGTCPNCPATGPGGPHVCPNCPKTVPGQDTSKVTTRTTHYTTNTVDNQRYPENRYPDNRSPDNRYPENRSPYSAPASPPYNVPTDQSPKQPNQGPPGTVYKYTTTNYTYNSSNDGGPPGGPSPSPFPVDGRRGPPSPFPRTESPAPRMQEPPKRLNDLLADFPGHENYPPENDLRKRPNPARGPGGAVNGLGHEKEAVQTQASKAQEQKALSLSKNIAGPAVYYPPGHETFARKDEAAAYQQAGGGYMKAKGNYKYEAESSSKSKSSSGAAVVPVCLPLCCAMPCVLL